MKASDLTNWGVFLISIRGMCWGVLLCVSLQSGALGSVPEHLLTIGAVSVVVVSVVITPVLRWLGWRRLAERVGDPNAAPSSGEVESALRALLGDGWSLQEAVRLLHQTRGWDVFLLSPTVATVANLPQKDTIRLVMAATSVTGSGAESPVV